MASDARPADVPPIRFASARGGRIAYQDFGGGAQTVFAIPPLAQNIELCWERAEIVSMLERLASFSRFIHFDKRGTGASDRRSRVPGLDERVDDVRAVMDDAGVESAHLFVQSEGGPTALMFAATYPDRVDGLVLLGTGAATVKRDMSPADRREYLERVVAYARIWGTPDSPVGERFAPSLAADATFAAWHQRYERHAATSESLREMLTISLDVDASEVLETLDVPTLVMHRTGDMVIPVEWGRELAERIPGALWREFEGNDHYAYAGDADAWLDEMEQFITGAVRTRSRRRRPGVVRVGTLGRFFVEVDGEEVPTSEWGSRLARQLLKRLVAARGWPVTREQLIDMLWPDEHELGKLSARLSVLLSTVRRILGGGVIADRETVRLDLDALTTDLEAFYAASDDEEIVDRFGGEFLPEDVYDDWTAGPRDEARARFVLAARRLADAAEARDDHDASIAFARRLIEVDRFDTDAHTRLVRSLKVLGEHREAERAHDALKGAASELGESVPDLEAI